MLNGQYEKRAEGAVLMAVCRFSGSHGWWVVRDMTLMVETPHHAPSNPIDRLSCPRGCWFIESKCNSWVGIEDEEDERIACEDIQ